MAENDGERIAQLESRSDSQKERLDDHEQRIRRLERLVFGVLAAAGLLGWVVSQANSLINFFN